MCVILQIAVSHQVIDKVHLSAGTPSRAPTRVPTKALTSAPSIKPTTRLVACYWLRCISIRSATGKQTWLKSCYFYSSMFMIWPFCPSYQRVEIIYFPSLIYFHWNFTVVLHLKSSHLLSLSNNLVTLDFFFISTGRQLSRGQFRNRVLLQDLLLSKLQLQLRQGNLLLCPPSNLPACHHPCKLSSLLIIAASALFTTHSL